MKDIGNIINNKVQVQKHTNYNSIQESGKMDIKMGLGYKFIKMGTLMLGIGIMGKDTDWGFKHAKEGNLFLLGVIKIIKNMFWLCYVNPKYILTSQPSPV